jgi:signal transduction histidine kinase
MQQLDEFSDYDDPVKKIMAEQTIEYEIIPRTAKILKELETVSLIAHNIEVASDSRREKSSDNLTFFIIVLSISIIIIGIVLSALFSRSITNPINQIEAIVWDLGKGLANKVTYKGADEEIDQMIQSVNNLSDKIQETAAFAVAIGNRNYTVPYLPLSDGDKLGKALLTMRDNIRTSEEELLKTTSSLIQRNKALEQYTFIVSHNLRAPVATIIGLAELLPADQVEDKDASVILQGVKEAAQKLDRVIHDLNRILEVRQQVYEGSEKVFLSRIAEDTKQLFQNIIQQEGIILEWDFSQIDTINSVKSYIESIFYNIISNSIKYRRADVVLKIDIQSQLKKDKIILSFTDNGKGIDTEKNSEKLFRLYERFDTSIEGKGMGMYMMKAQVDSLNGNITVKSALDTGTQITIELPLS